MKNYQKGVLYFGKRIGESRWATAILAIIGLTYFADFLSKVTKLYQEPAQLEPLPIFNTAGLLALSAAATFLAFLRIRGKEIRSRRILLFVSVAASWGALAPIMKIYPWNYVLMIIWIIVTLSACRKSQWELVQKKWAEEDQR